MINGILYKFFWGGGREKLKRDLINQPKKLGGLDMINFEDFAIGLKVKLIFKLLDSSFIHPWKNIVTNQLRYPTHPMISLEAGKAKSNRNFTRNLICCFDSWKAKVSKCRDQTINYCIWGGGMPSVGQTLFWNNTLINKNIFYISDFVNGDGQLHNYVSFRHQFNIRSQSFTKTEFTDIVLALRRFHTDSNNRKSLSNIGQKINLTIFLESRSNLVQIESKKIREMMIIKPVNTFMSQPQFRKWSDTLGGIIEETWVATFDNLYKTTNHMKSMQHHTSKKNLQLLQHQST